MTTQSIAKATISVPQISVSGRGYVNMTADVSVAAPPWGDLPRDDRSATAPRAATIRGARTWQQDPVLRHADTRKDRG